jgi:hypothetical protein
MQSDSVEAKQSQREGRKGRQERAGWNEQDKGGKKTGKTGRVVYSRLTRQRRVTWGIFAWVGVGRPAGGWGIFIVWSAE